MLYNSTGVMYSCVRCFLFISTTCNARDLESPLPPHDQRKHYTARLIDDGQTAARRRRRRQRAQWTAYHDHGNKNIIIVYYYYYNTMTDIIVNDTHTHTHER